MEEAVHRFVRLLRMAGLRIGVSEAADAMAAMAADGIAADRELTRSALRVSLVKDRRDEATFDWVFDRFFRLLPASGDAGDSRDHAHDDLSDTGDLETFSLSDSGAGDPDSGHSHGPPRDLTRYFDEDQLAARYNLHQEANRLDLASLTDEIALSADAAADPAAAARLQLTVSRLANPGRPSDLASPGGPRLDTELSVAEEMALEESVRRLLRSLRGAPRPRRAVAARGIVDGARTMRANMRFDGTPFRPVTVARVADRPRLVVLADVSLSVRATAAFTLRLVHELQSLAPKVRSFAFVADVAEITGLFAEHPPAETLSLVLSGLSGGGPLDVDADSDYGAALRAFAEEFGSAVTRKTTLLILGDGRGNGNDPGLPVFEELTRRAAETIWLTPEPRHSWGLGSCDLPAYAACCDRVYVARDTAGLERVAEART